MRKIDFLAPPDDTGGRNDSNGTSILLRKPDPDLQLLMTLYPGKVTLNVQETCDALSVSDDFIYQRLASGEIKGKRTGRNWIIPLTEVARLLNNGVK